jgi:hypothetical protein
VLRIIAAGSVRYLICQLLGVAAWAKRPKVLTYGPFIGLFAGVVTDANIIAARVRLSVQAGSSGDVLSRSQGPWLEARCGQE